MIPFIKSLAGICSLVVGVGVISGLIAAYSGQDSKRVKRSVDTMNQSGSGSSGAAANISNVPNQTSRVTFGEMWSSIEKSYKSKNENTETLPGQLDLKKIISNDVQDQKVWSLSSQEGGACTYSQQKFLTRCGFLHFKHNDGEYKLRVARDESGKGKIKIVKKDQQSVSYYRNEDEKGTTGNSDNFQKLTSFENSYDNFGEVYQDGIIFSKVEDK